MASHFPLDFEGSGPVVPDALTCVNHMEVGTPLTDANDRTLPRASLNPWPFWLSLLSRVAQREL